MKCWRQWEGEPCRHLTEDHSRQGSPSKLGVQLVCSRKSKETSTTGVERARKRNREIDQRGNHRPDSMGRDHWKNTGFYSEEWGTIVGFWAQRRHDLAAALKKRLKVERIEAGKTIRKLLWSEWKMMLPWIWMVPMETVRSALSLDVFACW